MISAEEIKSRLSMQHMAERYGFVLDRSSCIICPFHHDNHPSLRIYNEPGRGFYCYSCNAGGSVIDFVMRLFGLNYKQAIMRINSDFGYGGTASDESEMLRIRAERAEKARAEQKLQSELLWLAKAHCRLSGWLKTEPVWSDKWCEAMRELPDIFYRMEVLDCQTVKGKSP